MKLFYCDECKKEIKGEPHHFYDNYASVAPRPEYDLCIGCVRKRASWTFSKIPVGKFEEMWCQKVILTEEPEPDQVLLMSEALKEVPVPNGLVNCYYCGKQCMYTEAVEDWGGRGEVIRIGSLCDESDSEEKDKTRTEFAPLEEAIKEWNSMQTEEGR